MSAFDSYLFERRLPENGKLITIHNYITLLNVLAISFNYLIQYLSPTSKESFYYKLIAHSQGASIFAFCLIWTVLFKAIPHLDFHFFYCEGYYYRIGITCAGSYILLCITFGSYATSTVAGYMYRLYLLVDHNHILKVPHFFDGFLAGCAFMHVIVPSTTFHFGCSEFDLRFVGLNLTEEQLDYFKERSISSYTLRTAGELFYPAYFVLIIFATFLVGVKYSASFFVEPETTIATMCLLIGILQIIVQLMFATVRTVQKKQSMMSVGATKHHLRVLKVLTIQLSVNTSISMCVPLCIAFTIFIHVNSYIIYASLIIMGTNSMFQSLMTVYLNPISRKTVNELFHLHIARFRVPSLTIGVIQKLSH